MITSESIEPVFAQIIGKHWKQFSIAKENNDTYRMKDVLFYWWMSVRSMHNLVWATRCVDRVEESKRDLAHAMVVVDKHMINIARLIEEELGQNPLDKDGLKELDWDLT